MIVYSAAKSDFIDDVKDNVIEDKIYYFFKRNLGMKTSKNEILSWRNSMMYMSNVLIDPDIPKDSMVAIEYKIPQTSKRVDFILSGQDEYEKSSIVIVELKQWENATKTNKDAIVETFIGKSVREISHPSYQAWTYAALLKDFNSYVQEKEVQLFPCAYLHNCIDGKHLLDSCYSEHLEKAPLFIRSDVAKLTNFIKQNVRYGDPSGILYKIDKGKIRPSKSLADRLSSMLKGNQEFLMIDDQKVVYEAALDLAKKSSAKNKNILIVQGGPGSGKSVVAVNLLVKYTDLGLTSQYVTKNAAPRSVYEQKLTGSFRKSHITNLFSGSGRFSNLEKNSYDTLIVDESHRLNEKSGLYGNQGENQVKEIIQSSLFSVFFIDEEQRVTFKDIGTKEEIKKWAKKLGASIYELELNSQFRCNGSDGYLAWLDNTLQIRETANEDLSELRDEIFRLNKVNNSSRLVAGYCWEWVSKKNSQAFDIVIEDDFKMKWNLSSYGSNWIIHPESVTEVGCIHTCQGLELDYIGVIIGPDLIIRNGEVITDGNKRAKGDHSIRGFKKQLKQNREEAEDRVDKIIRNTYRTLMTRGLKGCFIYCKDEETRNYFKSKLRVHG